jgi:hypothetical protein
VAVSLGASWLLVSRLERLGERAGLLVPASLTGLGPPAGQDMLVAGWYAGLTLLALAYKS